MTGSRPPYDWLKDGIAAVFRVGTLIAMGIVLAGYLVGQFGPAGEGQRPLIDQLSGGGSVGIIAAGLLALTLLPVAVVIAAGIGFARTGERSKLLMSILVLALLLASIVIAVVLAQAG